MDRGILTAAGNARQASLTESMKDFDEVVIKPYRLDELLGKVEHAIRVQCSSDEDKGHP